jgi:hypothetical protein
VLLYVIGFVVLITGAAWIATVAGIPQLYVIGGALLLLGIGLFTGATRAMSQDPA